MKRQLLLLLSLGLLVLSACQRKTYNSVPSTGAPYEMFVIAPQELWNGAAGDTVRAILADDVEMINQPEPLYDLYSVNPGHYRTTTLNRHRNLLLLETGSQYDFSDMKAEYNVAATPQLVITVTSPSADSMAAFLHTYRNELAGIFDIAERERFIARASAHSDKSIVNLLREKFGITMSIPQGYRVRNDLPDFLWISFELPLASVGFSIYTYPAGEGENSTSQILLARNTAVSQIPGALEGSYMSTSTEVYPDHKLLTINGRQWNQVRGFWDVRGDFMGGPFINYSTYDERTGKMLAIDGYVYSSSPNNRLGQRNYIRQIEAIFLTTEFVD